MNVWAETFRSSSSAWWRRCCREDLTFKLWVYDPSMFCCLLVIMEKPILLTSDTLWSLMFLRHRPEKMWVSSVGLGLCVGSPLIRTCPDNLQRSSPRMQPDQMPGPPQLTPFSVGKQKLSSKLRPDDGGPHANSEPSRLQLKSIWVSWIRGLVFSLIIHISWQTGEEWTEEGPGQRTSPCGSTPS